MNKEEALNDFLKGLRIVLNNACAYSKEHPYLTKSVEVFKQKLDLLLRFLSPVRIGITPRSLFLDGRYWEKPVMYVEIASMLHLRKIKTIEFREGMTVKELTDFLSSVAMPTKEILRQGGFGNILSKDKRLHIDIEELDYSQFLHEAGGATTEESKDIWVYLLKQTVDKQDHKEIINFADNFGKILGIFNAKDLFEDEELKHNVLKFLNYLKEHQQEKFYNCSKKVFKTALNFKDGLAEKNLDNIKAFFKNFSAEELAHFLWDEINTEENFDTLNFKLFSQLTDGEGNKRVAASLLEKVSEKEPLKDNKKAAKNIQNLLTSSDAQVISDVYRTTLISLLSNISLKEGLSFDEDDLRMNYRYAIFNLFEAEKNRERLNLILEQMTKECDNAIKDRQLEHLKIITEIMDKKIKEEPSVSNLFEGLEKNITSFLESVCFEAEALSGLVYFIDRTKKIYQGFDYYCDKIFNEGKINPVVLRMLLKFFPQDLPHVYDNLGKRHSDIDFLVKVVKSLESIDTPLGLEMLKKIFYFSNNFIKIEVLKSMRNVSGLEENFLLSILKEKEPLLKKEAVLILTKNELTRKRAFAELLSIPSRLGRKNKIILQNLAVIEDLNYIEAREYLIALTRRPFFWNKNIRDRAKRILSRLKC
jgi:hypothetical protein